MSTRRLYSLEFIIIYKNKNVPQEPSIQRSHSTRHSPYGYQLLMASIRLPQKTSKHTRRTQTLPRCGSQNAQCLQ